MHQFQSYHEADPKGLIITFFNFNRVKLTILTIAIFLKRYLLLLFFYVYLLLLLIVLILIFLHKTTADKKKT